MLAGHQATARRLCADLALNPDLRARLRPATDRLSVVLPTRFGVSIRWCRSRSPRAGDYSGSPRATRCDRQRGRAGAASRNPAWRGSPARPCGRADRCDQLVAITELVFQVWVPRSWQLGVGRLREPRLSAPVSSSARASDDAITLASAALSRAPRERAPWDAAADLHGRGVRLPGAAFALAGTLAFAAPLHGRVFLLGMVVSISLLRCRNRPRIGGAICAEYPCQAQITVDSGRRW
jgi:hypothetical protein